MKKYIPLLFVGVLSSLLTFGGIYLWSHSSSGYFSNNANDQNNFSFVDYKGNYSMNVPDFVDAAETSVNAVVSVVNYSKNRRVSNPLEEFFFGVPRQQDNKSRPSGQGSGVIISEDGYIVTNNHVIQGADKIEITLNNQTKYTATLIGTDPQTDIALVKIDGKDLPHLKFVNSESINVGDWVLAIGNPFGLSSTVTAGIVSFKGRSIDILRQNSSSPIESFIQTDAAINPGNSGGALVNPNGDLVGINTAISSPTGAYSGYGFAVPSNLVKKVVEDIRAYGLVQRGYLGVEVLDLSDSDQVEQYNSRMGVEKKSEPGVMVLSLTENGGAAEAGIEEEDVITEVDGKDVKNFANLSFIVGNKRPGDKVDVKVKRGNKVKTYTVTLKDKQGLAQVRSKADLSVGEKLGASFEPLTSKQKVDFGIDEGVQVTDVAEGKLKSIGIGDRYIITSINGESVKKPKDVENILKGHKGKVSVDFIDPYGRIYRRGFEMD